MPPPFPRRHQTRAKLYAAPLVPGRIATFTVNGTQTRRYDGAPTWLEFLETVRLDFGLPHTPRLCFADGTRFGELMYDFIVTWGMQETLMLCNDVPMADADVSGPLSPPPRASQDGEMTGEEEGDGAGGGGGDGAGGAEGDGVGGAEGLTRAKYDQLCNEVGSDAAYRRLARKHHPDKGGTDADMQTLTEWHEETLLQRERDAEARREEEKMQKHRDFLRAADDFLSGFEEREKAVLAAYAAKAE